MWRVRPDERGMDEERAISVPLQPFHDRLADEHRLGELGRELRRSPSRPVGVRTRIPLQRLVQVVRIGGDVDAVRGEPAPPGWTALLPGVQDHRIEPRQNTFVGEEPGIASRDRPRVDRGVGVTEEHGVVPHGSGDQRDVGEAGVERGAVEQRPVLVLVRPRVQAGSRWAAGRGIGPMVGEQHASPGQCVECWGLEKPDGPWLTGISTPLVERDEQDVAFGRHAATLADPDRRGSATAEGRAPASRARSGGSHRRATELGPGADQPRSELR